MVKGLVGKAGDVVAQFVPLSMEYSYLAMAEDPVLAGAVKVTEADIFLVVMELMMGVPGVKMPVLVITRSPVPLCDTATNIPLP